MRRLLLMLVAGLVLAGCDGGSGGPTAGRALQLVGEPTASALSPTTTQVNGRVKNTAQRAHTGQVKVTVFDAEGKVTGTGYGPVVDLKPGEETTYTALISAPFSPPGKIEARVDLEMEA